MCSWYFMVFLGGLVYNVPYVLVKESVMVLVEYKCRCMTLAEWAEYLGMPRKTLEMRYKRGMRGSRLFAPVGQAR